MSVSANTGTEERSKTDEAKQQGRQVADAAKDEASSVADTARDEAGHVAEAAKDQARSFLGDIQDQLRDQGEQQAGRVAEALHGLSERLQALQEGRTEDAGALADYVEEARSRVDGAARRVDDLGLEGLLDETRRFARRRPGAFLGAATVAGLVIGRVTRAGRDAQNSDGGGSAARGTGGGQAQIPPATSATTTSTTSVGTDDRVGRQPGTAPPTRTVVDDEVGTAPTESLR